VFVLDRDRLIGMLPRRFSKVALVARGGQGVVFKALLDTKPVAIKVVPADGSDAIRLRLELERLGDLDNPSVAHPVEVLELDGFVALVMEWIEGETLAEHLKNRWMAHPAAAPLPATDAMALVTRILHILADLLELNPPVIHCDIKPSNVILRNRQPNDPVLVDFGAIREVLTTSRHTSTILGTPGYIAPEYLHERRISPRADVYAVGSLLAELVSGRGPDLEAALEILRPYPVWRRFLQIARASEPGSRFADAREALRFLESPVTRIRWSTARVLRKLSLARAAAAAAVLALGLSLAAVRVTGVAGGPVVPVDDPASGLSNVAWLSGRTFLGLERWRWSPEDGSPVGSWAAGRDTVAALSRPGYLHVASGRRKQIRALLDRTSGSLLYATQTPPVRFRPHWSRAVPRTTFDGYLPYFRLTRFAGRFGGRDAYVLAHCIWYPSALRIEDPRGGSVDIVHPGKIVDVWPWTGPGGRPVVLALAINNMWGHRPAIFAVPPPSHSGILLSDGLYDRRGKDPLEPLFYTFLPGTAVGNLRIVTASRGRIVADVNRRRLVLDGSGRRAGTAVDPAAASRQFREVQAGLAARASGDEETAALRLAEAESIPGTDPLFRSGIELVLARWAILAGDAPDARTHCERALAIDPTTTDAALWLAVLDALAGRPTPSDLPTMNEGVDWQVMLDLSLANAAAGDRTRADAMARSAGSFAVLAGTYLETCTDPGSAGGRTGLGYRWYFLPHLLRARALLSEGSDLSRSLDELELAGVLAEPYDVFSLEATRALLLQQLGRGDEVVERPVREELETLRRLSATRPMARFELVWALDHVARLASLRGHSGEAQALAQEAIRRGTGLVPAAVHEARKLLETTTP